MLSGARVIGFDPNPMDREQYIDHIKSCVSAPDQESEKTRDQFCKICHYLTIDKNGGDHSFDELRHFMESFEGGKDGQIRLFYMALPPTAYVSVSEQLKRCCKSKDGVSRIVVSIPFHVCRLRDM